MKFQVLTIAGSDCSGGAGIQADLKAMSANGVYAMSVLTAITAQNTKGVNAIEYLSPHIIGSQIDAIFDDFQVSAVKTGMLGTAAIVELISEKLTQYPVPHLVVDPVMVAKSGAALLEPEAIALLKSKLIPLALLITPNIQEAEQLSGLTIRTLVEARQAAKIIHRLGCRHVLIKGGHLLERPGTDLLYDGRFFRMYPGEWIDSPNTHGTGCAYASAITAHLAQGVSLPDAVETAKTYITEAIRSAVPIGHGQGPINHFYFLNPRSS